MIEAIQYLYGIQAIIDRLAHDTITQAIDWLHVARMNRKRIFIMGNGGSAMTAAHFACDLNKNTRNIKLPDFQAICLSDNIAMVTALANDEGYDRIFEGQLRAHCRPDDIVIAISTSGNSLNVINALQLAKKLGVRAIGMTGFDGGKLRNLVDLELHVPSDCIEQVEDIHLVFAHLMTKTLREKGQSFLQNMQKEIHIANELQELHKETQEVRSPNGISSVY